MRSYLHDRHQREALRRRVHGLGPPRSRSATCPCRACAAPTCGAGRTRRTRSSPPSTAASWPRPSLNGQVQIGAGDFTFYIKNGWLIENGKITAPIKDVNIIGNGPEALRNITMVANDLKLDNGGWTCGKNGQGVPVSQGHADRARLEADRGRRGCLRPPSRSPHDARRAARAGRGGRRAGAKRGRRRGGRRRRAGDAASSFAGATGSWRTCKENATRGLSVALYVDGRYSTHATNDLDPSRLERFLARGGRAGPPPGAGSLPADPGARALRRPGGGRPGSRRPRGRRPRSRGPPRLVPRDERPRAATTSPSSPRRRRSWTITRWSVARARTASPARTSRRRSSTAPQVTIRDGEKRPEDYWFVGGTPPRGSARSRTAVGQEALDRALARAGARSVASRKTAMIVHPEAGATLLGRLARRALGGCRSSRSGRTWHERLGKRSRLRRPRRSTDDPLIPRGLGLRALRRRGHRDAAEARSIEDGVLQNYYVDTYYGRKLGWRPDDGLRLEPRVPARRSRPRSDPRRRRRRHPGNLVARRQREPDDGRLLVRRPGHVVRGRRDRPSPIAEMNVTGQLRRSAGASRPGRQRPGAVVRLPHADARLRRRRSSAAAERSPARPSARAELVHERGQVVQAHDPLRRPALPRNAGHPVDGARGAVLGGRDAAGVADRP